MHDQLLRRKPLASLQDEGTDLRRHLSLTALTMLGIGGTIGAGIFVLTGTAAANFAGPGIAISFVVAGIACLCAALCYAELASMLPCSGSAYTYAYATLGEGVAWTIGWALVLEYLFATSTVAVGWSGYFSAALDSVGMVIPDVLRSPPVEIAADGTLARSGSLINLPATVVVLALTAILSLGIRSSSRTNAALVMIKLLVILLVICFGAFHVATSNWTPFVPPNTGTFGEFGWSGVMRGAAVAFYAYIGFDMVSASSQEARNPKRDIPLALIFTLGICTALYVGMALIMTGLAPYQALNVPHPVYVAIEHGGPGLAWLAPLVGIGAILGLASAMLVCIYGQSRIFYRMAQDGLIPPAFARVSPRSQAPVFGTWFVGITAATIAGVLPIDLLGQLVSIGTLLAFAIVCAGVLVLRRIEPAWPRAFRAPAVWPVAVTGITACLYMMVSLPAATWIRLIGWLLIGAAIYFGYGRRRSQLADSAELAPQPAE